MSNVDVVKKVYEAFARGEIPTVLGAMDPGIRWYPAEGHPYMSSGKALIGHDAILNGLFARIAADWDAFAVHPQSFYDAGDTVIVEARYGGTYKPTGRSLDAQGCHLWDVKDGKVTRFQQYVDTAKLQDVMGNRPSQ